MSDDAAGGADDPLERLLLVQEHDIALGRLEYQRAHLPARAEREKALADAKQLMPVHRELTARRAGVEAAERRIDDEVSRQRAKATEVDTKLYSGEVVSPRELQALQAELESLRAYIAKLEDDELEQMTQREDVDSELAPVEQRITDLQREVQRCDAAIADGEREVDALIAEERAARRRRARTRRRPTGRLRGASCAQQRQGRGAPRRRHLPGLPADRSGDRSRPHAPRRQWEALVLR